MQVQYAGQAKGHELLRPLVLPRLPIVYVCILRLPFFFKSCIGRNKDSALLTNGTECARRCCHYRCCWVDGVLCMGQATITRQQAWCAAAMKIAINRVPRQLSSRQAWLSVQPTRTCKPCMPAMTSFSDSFTNRCALTVGSPLNLCDAMMIA